VFFLCLFLQAERVAASATLPNFGKPENRLRQPCRTSANLKIGFGNLAELRKTRKSAWAALPNFGKHENPLGQPCRASENPKIRLGSLAELRKKRHGY